MSKKRLIYYEILKYQPENLDFLHRHFDVIVLADPSHDTDEVLRGAEVLLAPLGYYCGREKMDACPGLIAVGSNTTGHPHIDVDYARQRGVAVVTLKNEHEFLDTITPTAELTWGLIIAVTRNMIPAVNFVMDGGWDRRPFGGRAMLSRMSLGVVGLGRLGKKVARYGVCFGMKVKYYDPHVNQGPSGVGRVGTLEDLVGASDVVTVHVPHEPETENMFSREVFSGFKPGSYFINTSRGELVDHDALLERLADGTLAGAGMDVFPGEFAPGFDIKAHPLWQYAKTHKNVVFTPHIGGSTVDAWRLTERHTLDRLLAAVERKS